MTRVRAGLALKMFRRRIGHAPINFTNLDLIFFTRCSSCTSRRIECRPYGVFFLFFRDMTDPTPRKKQNRPKLRIVKKTTTTTIGPTLNPFERTVQIRG